MRSEVTKFRKSWSQLTHPTLFVRSKWHTTERNIPVSDLLLTVSPKRNAGQLGKVVSTNPESKGAVRDVNVRVPSDCVPVIRAVDART